MCKMYLGLSEKYLEINVIYEAIYYGYMRCVGIRIEILSFSGNWCYLRIRVCPY